MTGASSCTGRNPERLECLECRGLVLGVSTDPSLTRLNFLGLVKGVDSLEVALDVEPRLAGSILSLNDRNSTASLLISPSMSPDLEYPSALRGTIVATGLIGSLIDRE